MTILRCWNCGTPVSTAADEFCKPCRIALDVAVKRSKPHPGSRLMLAFNPSQPAHGYTRNVTPRGPIVRQEDAFPESCCEANPTPEGD